jgi:CheY-like chemotaxis protein
MDLKKGRSPVVRLEQALKAIGSAANLTQQLLAFSRKQIIEPKVIDLNDVLSGMRQMLSRLIGEDVELIITPGHRLGRVKVDPGQIEQIVINLSANARDAMPNGGKLMIETANVVLDTEHCKHHRGVLPGEYVSLSISDTGVGMTREVLEQIFEPFFTTKAIGKGTGLGLAMVYGAVKQNGGTIGVYSEPGHGTTLRIYLPRVSGRPQPVSAVIDVGDLPQGTETVLLVEDETFIRSFTEQILQRLGYSVISCSGLKEAIEQANGHDGPIHLLLTDVVLPDGNARLLARLLAEERPDIRVLFTSGYAENVIAHHGILDSGVQFIGKPFTVAALANKIREVLG